MKVWSGENVPRARKRILLGGKGFNLAELQDTGVGIPRWYAITTEAFRETLREAGVEEKISGALSEPEAASRQEEISSKIRQWILDIELPTALVKEIRRIHDNTFPKDSFLAVRSSASDEDASSDSFAGLHDSFLFVRGQEKLFDSIRGVWASMFHQRALAYRREKKLPLKGIAVAVLVQEMVNARTSGVMFTAHPVSGDPQEIVINSVFGIGEGLVSGGLDADQFTFHKGSKAVKSTPIQKLEQFLPDETKGGVYRTELPPDMRNRPSLSETQIRELASAGLLIERYFHRPQDIEFCHDRSGALFILQSRAVTTASEYGPAAGNRIVWDNSNIVESYSGVTSPMTFSFIRRAYAIVYHCFSEVMGISPKVVKANQKTFDNMLGFFQGQVYYNLINWYRLVALFPGFQFNKRFMESMMGVKQPVEMQETASTPSFSRRYFVELPALLRLLARSGLNFLRIRKIVDQFDSDFTAHMKRWDAMDFERMSPAELMSVWEDMEKSLLWNWKAPIINDFFVMIFYGSLKRRCHAWCGDEKGSLQNDLICGEGGIISTEPTKFLLRLGKMASEDPALKERLLREAPEDLLSLLEGSTEFSVELRRYLDLYGFRCLNELKLEEHSLRDKPEFVFGILRNYLAANDPSLFDLDAKVKREQEIRRQAEERAFASMGFAKRAIFRWVLRNARFGVKNRENMRFARTQIYGRLRELIRAVGRNFADEGILEQSDDVFFLAFDEMWDFVKGTSVTIDLRGLVAVRKREFESFRVHPKRPDDRFETFGVAYHKNYFQSPASPQAMAPTDGSLQGVGCSPGIVTGTVKVMLNPRSDMKLSGEILVAERTDPGWVPFYPSASGVLIERGSILSHSAIVAREMGIPTIVGIPNLCKTLRSGQKVQMNGSDGRIRILDSTAS